ncbi:restriction endonuclease subunit S [Staphylococcus saprophyticus]|nr:restriction endonuclease subunit S [Staphylococcus saprophyticus]
MTKEVKNVPDLRFSEFKGAWEEKKLSDVGYYSKSYPYSRAIEGEGIIHHIHYGDIHSKLPSKINDINLLPTIVENRNFEFVKKGDIIFADASEDYKDLGKAVLVNIEDNNIIASLHTHVFRLNKEISAEFLMNFTKTLNYYKFIKKQGTGISVLGISKKNLSNLTLNIPEYNEQQKIGIFFSKLDRQIELEEQKLEKLEEQKKGYMQQIFSQQLRFKDENGNEYPEWEEKKLGDILERGNKDKVNEIGKYRRLTISLHGKGLYEVKQERKTKDTRPFYQRFEGELIIGKQNFFNGSIAIVTREFNGFICSNAIMSYKISNHMNRKYLLEYLLQNDFLRKNEYLADGTGQKELSEKKFEELEIKLPNSINEQQKIGVFLERLDNLIEKQSNKLELLKQRKKSFLQKMFV